jgi:hypothetical protein
MMAQTMAAMTATEFKVMMATPSRATMAQQQRSTETARVMRDAVYLSAGKVAARRNCMKVSARLRAALGSFSNFPVKEEIEFVPRGQSAWAALTDGAGVTYPMLAEKESADYHDVALLMETGKIGMLKHAKHLIGVTTPSAFVVIGAQVHKSNEAKAPLAARVSPVRVVGPDHLRITVEKAAFNADEMTPHAPSDVKPSTVQGVELISGRVHKDSPLLRSAIVTMPMAEYSEVASAKTAIFSFKMRGKPDGAWLRHLAATVHAFAADELSGMSCDGSKLRVRMKHDWTLLGLEGAAKALGAVFVQPADPALADMYRKYRTEYYRQGLHESKAASKEGRVAEQKQSGINVTMVVADSTGGRITGTAYREVQGVLKDNVRAIHFSRTYETIACEVDDDVALDGATIGGYVFSVEHVRPKPRDDALATRIGAELQKMRARNMSRETYDEAQRWGVPPAAVEEARQKHASAMAAAGVRPSYAEVARATAATLAAAAVDPIVMESQLAPPEPPEHWADEPGDEEGQRFDDDDGADEADNRAAYEEAWAQLQQDADVAAYESSQAQQALGVPSTSTPPV